MFKNLKNMRKINNFFGNFIHCWGLKNTDAISGIGNKICKHKRKQRIIFW